MVHFSLFPDNSDAATRGQRKNATNVISIKFRTANTIRDKPVLSAGGFTSRFEVLDRYRQSPKDDEEHCQAGFLEIGASDQTRDVLLLHFR